MNSSHRRALRTACKRYGPGRLPGAERHGVGAGYAAATAAFVATALYAGSMVVGGAIGMTVDSTVNVLFAAFALPFVLPAAFLVGVVGWRLRPARTSSVGAVAGMVGAVATYLVTLVFVGTLLTAAAALSLNGAEPVSAAAFSWGLVYFAFVFTWWVTIPVGCLAGVVYVNVVETEN